MTSKYSALPDIDDQPDVYETPDLSEDSPNVSIENQSSEDEAENVDTSRVSVKETSSRFNNSVVDDADFSDHLNRRKKAMYRTFVKRPPALETNEYEILPKELTLEETPLQKLRRLMYEVQELNEDIERQKEPINTKETLSQSDILSQITYLQSDLVRMSQQMSEGDEKPNYGRSVEEAKTLVKQLEAFKSASVQNGSTPGDDAVTYELYYTPEAAKMQKENNLSDIDDRISKIEKLIGANSGQALDELPSQLAAASLIQSLSKLEQQISVLAQPRQLEVIARRVKVLNSDLDRINESKSGRKDNISTLGFGLSQLNTQQPANTEVSKDPNDSESKVNKLFTTLEKVDPLLNLTPVLLTRLKALQGLHTEATSFAQSVKIISEEQTRMTDEVKSLTQTCDLLNKSIKENDESITNNIKIIDDRMTSLIERINALNK